MNNLSSINVMQDLSLHQINLMPLQRNTAVTTSTNFVTLSSAIAKTEVVASAPGQDLILRFVQHNPNSAADVSAWKTIDFQSALSSILAQKDSTIDKLKNVTNWQKHRLDYQAVYNAYLLGSLDENEFIEESEKFSTEYQKIESGKLAIDIQTYSNILDFNLTSSDYADFFGVELSDITQAISFLAGMHSESPYAID
jgi:hypothetical protein